MAKRTMITLGGDLRVGRIGYGAMRLTGPDLWGDYPDRDGGITLLRQAVEAGVPLIGTGGVYREDRHAKLIPGRPPPPPRGPGVATEGGVLPGGRRAPPV